MQGAVLLLAAPVLLSVLARPLLLVLVLVLRVPAQLLLLHQQQQGWEWWPWRMLQDGASAAFLIPQSWMAPS